MKIKSGTDQSVVLDDLHQEKAIEQADYKAQLREYQLRMLKCQRLLKESRNSLIVVIEGPDAAGKGGAVKRLVEKLDPRAIRVYSIVRPTAEEYQHHYLWRFWTKLPPYGQIAIFDRSWYGRVLVERVEKFATEKEWKRAYEEIRQFEKTLIDDGAILVKLYFHISKDEQLKRFRERESDPYKHWKINEEDWRNRRKWKQHNHAAEDMFRLTSTPEAPWHVIPANYKWYARVKALQAVVKTMEAASLKPMTTGRQ
jgi:PPK2 family polyphosphate:nucleotide phosphotransferase